MTAPDAATAQPSGVSILSQAAYLIVSIHTALDDSQLERLRQDLLDQVQSRRARGIIIDVAALDVLDSFATRTLSQIARAAQLKGALTVVVGISPEMAIAMVQLSRELRFARTALDLEEGLALLHARTGPPQPGATGRA